MKNNRSLISVSWPVFVLMLATSLGAGRCRVRSRRNSASSEPEASQNHEENREQRARLKKMSGYTNAYNSLIGPNGLSATQQRYLKANIPKQKAKGNIYVTVGWLDGAYNNLKEARAVPDVSIPELDQSAGALIAALDKLVPPLEALEVYYKSKTYKEDDLARGKAEDPAIRAAFEQSLEALDTFKQAFVRQAKARAAE